MWLCAGHVGGTRGLCIVSSAADMIWLSVVRGDERCWWRVERGGEG